MPYLNVGRTSVEEQFQRIRPLDEDYIVTPDFLKHDLMDKGPWRKAYPVDADHYVFQHRDSHTIVDVEIAWPNSTGADLIEMARVHQLRPEAIYLAMKLSHRFKASPHFLKTMADIKHLRAEGVVVPVTMHEWSKRRTRETLAYHQHPNLDQMSKGFFTDNIKYVYVHDTIHLGMARPGGHPAYQDFQMDGAEVRVSRAKFEALPLERRIDSVLEESYVLALERHQIPNNFQPDPDVSFRIALEKVCTTISSGWWREFAWEHYDDAIRLYDRDYVRRFHSGVASGVIKLVP